MTSEEKILERLEAIEGRLAALQERGENSRALMEQLTPIGNHAFRLLVEELECLNGRVSLDDILDLGRKGLLSVPKLTWLLDQLENLSDLWRILHPAVGPTFPHVIAKMDAWEKDGVFEKLAALKRAGGGWLEGQGPEDIARLGAGLAFLTRQLQRLADPELQARITRLLDAAGEIDLAQARPTGLLGLLATLRSSEGRQALGLLAELTRTLGKAGGQSAPQ
ncbi:hypothetical protein [Desulfovibrio legallii]|uniref:DUF1641 domain-containing protein n=1 Tax=Desulfovibrio legallii TaxID=571438 RepID=A0A1G7L470_9BACT|nr:hypothetical protein [Desulfovibrio legallii]SDF44255.1 hypothetical protein SAMN05192586_105116 [Desulfovibrio legallii]